MAVRSGHSNGGRRSKGERRLVVTRLAADIARTEISVAPPMIRSRVNLRALCAENLTRKGIMARRARISGGRAGRPGGYDAAGVASGVWR